MNRLSACAWIARDKGLSQGPVSPSTQSNLVLLHQLVLVVLQFVVQVVKYLAKRLVHIRQTVVATHLQDMAQVLLVKWGNQDVTLLRPAECRLFHMLRRLVHSHQQASVHAQTATLLHSHHTSKTAPCRPVRTVVAA